MKMQIMISGPQGSGKTTLMEQIRIGMEREGFTVYNVIFADTIYKIHDYAITLLESRGIKRNLVKDGDLLQLLGTEWGRNTIDENIWVKCLQGQMNNILITHEAKDNIAFIVSDCRFRNEFDGLDNTFKIRLEAPKEIRKARCSQWRERDNHPSEIDLDGYAREGRFDLYLDTARDLDRCVAYAMTGISAFATGGEWKNLFWEVKEKYYDIPSNIILSEN